VQRAQGFDDDHVAAFHVGHALAADLVAIALPHGHVGTGLEHGVEVTEQQQALAAVAVARGDEVAGAAHPGRQLDPARGKAEGVELLAEQRAHVAHAAGIHRAAVDEDALLEQGERLRRMRLDLRDDFLLGRVEPVGPRRL